jgi:hypothetical protein
LETKEHNITELAHLLSEGADERIFLNEDLLTKYGTPLVRDNYVNRGSCTCSAARAEDVKLIKELIEKNSSISEWAQLKNDLAKELKHELAWQETNEFELFFAPSGTDLVYFPLIFSQLLHPEKRVKNLITCIEELGSGTKLSSQGKFYANYNQFGESIPKGETIASQQEVNTIFFNARAEDGKIKKNSTAIREMVKEHPNDLIIVNLVYGSKSGIEDDLKMIDEIKADNLQWVVDICQFRHSREILHNLVSKGAMVMITGSKFYESSPFSGAMLVPKNLYNQLLSINDWSAVANYASIFSTYDVPEELETRTPFTKQVNKAGLLRWACALASIKAFNQLEEGEAENKTNLWRNTVFSLLEKRSSFELMPHQEKTNKSIVSFRVLKDGKYLNITQLKELYFSIVKGEYKGQYPFDHLTIGQPVSYGEKAFLRLAIGAKTTKQFVEENQTTFETDRLIIEIIEQKLAALEIS